MAVLAGKVAIVTGAASGIGRAIALRYRRERAIVHVVDVNTSNDATFAVGAILTVDGGQSILHNWGPYGA